MTSSGQARMWMVRAGEGGSLVQSFLEQGMVAVGWRDVGDLRKLASREQILQTIVTAYPAYKPQKAAITASHLYRLASEIRDGDWMVTYDPEARLYHLGVVVGAYSWDPARIESHPHSRQVRWERSVSRDALSIPTRHRLGSIATLFEIAPAAAAELLAGGNGEAATIAAASDEAESSVEDSLADIQTRAKEFIKDMIIKLEWDEMQELVAGLLRAMGYKTRVSPAGPDRGKDIIASPDGLGFEQPRIVVEVKHREGRTPAPQIRSFLGGRHKDDKGLYVSTGGFTSDALYEADRAPIPLTLMGIDEVVESLLDNYDKMDADSRALVPLTRVLWPAERRV